MASFFYLAPVLHTTRILASVHLSTYQHFWFFAGELGLFLYPRILKGNFKTSEHRKKFLPLKKKFFRADFFSMIYFRRKKISSVDKFYTFRIRSVRTHITRQKRTSHENL